MEAALGYLSFVSRLWPNPKRQISSSPHPDQKLAFSHTSNRDRPTRPPQSEQDNKRMFPKPYQAQNSPLLTKLPPEIRERIWQYALGGKVIRLRLEPGKFLHFWNYFESGIPISKINSRHFSQSHLDLYYDHQGVGVLRGVDHSKNGYEIPAGLLRVCRVIYLEASHILYRQNIFFMESDAVLLNLREHHVSRKIYTGIRHLRLGLSCPRIERTRGAHEPPSEWERLWAAVAGLELASLGVHMVYSYDVFSIGIEAPAMLPLLDVRGVDVVHLVIRSSSKASIRKFDLEEEIKQQWQRPASITPGGC